MLLNSFYNRPFPEPSFFSLDDLRDEDEQNSPLLRLENKLLDKIIEYVPLKDRLLRVRSVCHRMSDCVKRTVKSIEFLRDELDYCSDAKIAFFLSVYGKRVEHVNFDLFRSCSLREYTQWSWRQSVISCVARCPQLKRIDILVCCRHRLRDGDLSVIFKQCPLLDELRMDASFLNGHCFLKAPPTLSKIELECCQSITKPAFLGLCQRLPRLHTLHLSLFEALDEATIKKIGDFRALKTLSLCAAPDKPMNTFRLAEIRRIATLETLCLDGVNNVTDKFLGDLCDVSHSPAARSIRHLSIAWCRNVGPNGVARLRALPRLASLNLDGITKRDISTGVEAIGRAARLERLLVSEDCFVSARTIVDVVARCETLRTLDVSNNHRLVDKTFAEQVYSARAYTFAAPMLILTDAKWIWRRLPAYSHRNRVEIVNTQATSAAAALEDRVDAISCHTPQQVPRGYLIPELRRGNRHKFIDFSAVAPTPDSPPNFGQQQENVPPPDAEQLFAGLSEQERIELLAWLEYEAAMRETTTTFKEMDFENAITVGSAGAPEPPSRSRGAEAATATGAAGVLKKYSRPSRPKRQAQKERAAEQQRHKSGRDSRHRDVTTTTTKTTKGPAFTDDDFPPLG